VTAKRHILCCTRLTQVIPTQARRVKRKSSQFLFVLLRHRRARGSTDCAKPCGEPLRHIFLCCPATGRYMPRWAVARRRARPQLVGGHCVREPNRRLILAKQQTPPPAPPPPAVLPARSERASLAGRATLGFVLGRVGPPPQARRPHQPQPKLAPAELGDPRAAPSRARGWECLGVRSRIPLPPAHTDAQSMSGLCLSAGGDPSRAGEGGRTTATGCPGGTVAPARDGRTRRSVRRERRPFHAKTRAATFRRRPGRREGGGERGPRGAFFPAKLIQPL